tara:strand:+ start:110 stop:718 length:609 start_codon:yes stop_codon:yes gene_type:complete
MISKEILNSHPVSTLKKEIAKTNVKGYSKMKKAEVVELMMKHKEKFGHIKKKEKAKPAEKPKAKSPPKPKAKSPPKAKSAEEKKKDYFYDNLKLVSVEGYRGGMTANNSGPGDLTEQNKNLISKDKGSFVYEDAKKGKWYDSMKDFLEDKVFAEERIIKHIKKGNKRPSKMKGYKMVGEPEEWLPTNVSSQYEWDYKHTRNM